MFHKLKHGLISVLVASSCFSQSVDNPNILFIICDDLNQIGLGAMEDPVVYAPNIDSLVSESIVFTNAHANVAGCGPSRASMFSGVLPQTSGLSGYRMSQNSWLDNPILSETTSVFKQFLDNGYEVYGAGKVYHAYRLREEDFTEFYSFPTQGPFAYNKRIHSDMPESFDQTDMSFARLENVPSYPEYTGWQHRNGTPFFFESDENRDLLADELTVNWCSELLASYASDSSGQPFFLSAGIYNPHEPFHVPAKYWDLYDTTSFDFDYLRPDTTIPVLTALTNRYNFKSNQGYDTMREESPSDDPDFYLRQFIHGYYASVSFVDDQVGVLLDALEEHGLSENTIVILTSDHGFHLGSKGLVAKSTLWNDATAVPFIIKVPGEVPQIINDPVSLIDLYPTLLEYGGIPYPESHELEGKPVQEVIDGNRNGDALLFAISRELLEVGELSSVEHSHHALLIGEFKYIHYSSGEDELYHTSVDFKETNDLSEDVAYQGIRNSLFRELERRVGTIRSPLPGYECLYYGDFEQDLNGWLPSEPNENLVLNQPDSLIDSQHLMIAGNSSTKIKNENIVFRSQGEHILSLKSYSGDGSGQLSIKIMSSDDIIILDTTLTVFSEPTNYEIVFNVVEPTPSFGEVDLFIEATAESSIHLDDVFVRDEQLKTESLAPCQFAEELQTDVLPVELEGKNFVLFNDQNSVFCEAISGGAHQLWQRFAPTGNSGIIAAQIDNYNPIIEVFSDCDDQSPICLNERFGSTEFYHLEDLIPNFDYYVRITSARDIPVFNPNEVEVQSVFINTAPAVIKGEAFQKVQSNGFLEVEIPIGSDYPISQVSFNFLSEQTGELFQYELAVEPSSKYPIAAFEELELKQVYSVSVSYSIGPFATDVPFGPTKQIRIHHNTSVSTISIFPNPTDQNSSTLTIMLSGIELGNGTVRIFDQTGRKLFERNTELVSNSLTLSNLPSFSQGLYVVVLESEGQKISKELLFVH
jgi:arylsulfatase A-like enzyme